jgi:hypothetical protein
MSIHHYTSLHCNVSMCGHWTDNGETAREIRRRARLSGWRRIDGEDVCPRHPDIPDDATASDLTGQPAASSVDGGRDG